MLSKAKQAISQQIPPASLWTPTRVTGFYVRLVKAQAEGEYLARVYWPALAQCRSFEAERAVIGRMEQQIAASGDAQLLTFWQRLTGEDDLSFERITCCACREHAGSDLSPDQRCDCRCHWM